jgi:hypothetical protein
MSNLIDHAKTEFRVAGWMDEHGKYSDEMQGMICDHVLKLIEMFSDEGHSGSSAPYAINLFTKLAKFEPITPLTGEDDEWVRHDYGAEPTYQNKRASHVFKDADGKAYDIDGKVFWEWSGTKEDPYKSHYTCRESRVYITFPYTPHTEYVYRYSDATPPAPLQNEQGLL